MSFFEEDDEPRARSPRSRRPAPSGGAAADQQTLLIRRAVALGAAVLFLILLVIAVRGCLDSRKKDSLKEYNQRVHSIAGESSATGTQLFEELTGEGGPQLQTRVSEYRQAAENHLNQAKRLDVPDDMAAAQRSFLIVLELRRNALQLMSERIGEARSDQESVQRKAVEAITGQMQALLASDVLLLQRVGPLVNNTLADNELAGQEECCRGQRFLPGVEWLSTTTVARAVGATVVVGEQQQQAEEEERPEDGTYGTGLVSVAVGETTLEPGSANRIPSSEPPTFAVTFANQGEMDEENIKVTVTAGDAKGEAVVDEIPQGTEATAEVTLDNAPPVNQTVTIAVEVGKAPGEEKLDNNEQEYQALFTP